MLFRSHPRSKKVSTARKTGPLMVSTYRGFLSTVFFQFL